MRRLIIGALGSILFFACSNNVDQTDTGVDIDGKADGFGNDPAACFGESESVRYEYAMDDRGRCFEVDIMCYGVERYFFNDCGCGCITPEALGECPEEGGRVSYRSRDSGECYEDLMANAIFCGVNDALFVNSCGCGCVEPAEEDSEEPSLFCQALCDVEVACIEEDTPDLPEEEIEAFTSMCLEECAFDETRRSADEILEMSECISAAAGDCEAYYMSCSE